MLTIHFGLYEAEMPAFKRQFERHASILVRSMGENEGPIILYRPELELSRWYDWFERYENVSGDPRHITLNTLKPMQDINFIANHFQSFLVPMDASGLVEELRIALTDFNDWKQDYEEFRW